MKKQIIDVVGAVILNDAGRVLCALRSSEMKSPNLWEFPGGKIEPDETPKEALAREIWEEFQCRIQVVEQVEDTIDEHEHLSIRLRTFYARICEGVPIPQEHAALRWVAPKDLESLDWTHPDLPTVRRVITSLGLCRAH